MARARFASEFDSQQQELDFLATVVVARRSCKAYFLPTAKPGRIRQGLGNVGRLLQGEQEGDADGSAGTCKHACVHP
jgi:hypothetical protein